MMGVVMEFNGYWEDEPGNGTQIWVNTAGFTHITVHSYDSTNQPLEFKIHFPNAVPFIVDKSSLNLSPPIYPFTEKEEN